MKVQGSINYIEEVARKLLNNKVRTWKGTNKCFMEDGSLTFIGETSPITLIITGPDLIARAKEVL